MGDNNQLFPEEDEDLEALRLAALQSLKKKTNNDIYIPTMNSFGTVKDSITQFNASPRGKQKRTKFFRLQQGRNARNGQFNGWTRNSNLIAVPMIGDDNIQENVKTVSLDVPKLILPQDRYCKTDKVEVKIDGVSSKFDRYNNSDESESSESEEESTKSDVEEKSELKRSDSLEALMAELENEIQGGKPQEEKSKSKSKKKRRNSQPSEYDDKLVESNKTVTVLKENLKPDPIELKIPNDLPLKKPLQNDFLKQRKWQNKPRRQNHTGNFVTPNLGPPPEILTQVVSYSATSLPTAQSYPLYNPAPMGFSSGLYIPQPSVVFETPPPQLPPLHVAPPNVYERPRSPLTINTDAYSTNTLAPLSPRSAAFVLENRAIIEKRKRRSYSRSPSPLRFRRSKSPKRLSLSPTPAKRRSLSPSPVRKVLAPKTNSPKKSASVHDRLGLKSLANQAESNQSKQEKGLETVDPVLEARRKKFERNEITMKEGVIRLKAKEDEEVKEVQEDQSFEDIVSSAEGDDEDALLEIEDALLIDEKVDAILFSDDESNSDNEGRFKTKHETNQKVAVLPFTKLIDGSKGGVKNSLKLENTNKNERMRRFRSRSPSSKNLTKKTVRSQKKDKMKQSVTFPIDNRKIEIKIRNPAKYKKADGSKEENCRKVVEILKKVEPEETSNDVTNLSVEDVPTSIINEGDLRAQLSRKRAERQKLPVQDVVPSRLLQNALQGVGFKAGKKTKGSEENIEGKLPIHLRLGTTNSLDSFGKKSRKHKNKGSQEQV